MGGHNSFALSAYGVVTCLLKFQEPQRLEGEGRWQLQWPWGEEQAIGGVQVAAAPSRQLLLRCLRLPEKRLLWQPPALCESKQWWNIFICIIVFVLLCS